MNTNRKLSSQLFLVCLAAGLFAACGGTSLDQAESIRATAAALTASQMAESQVQSGINGKAPSGITVTNSGGQFSVSGTITNSEGGGTLTIDAQGTLSTDGNSFTYTAALTYVNWKDVGQNITLNGTLSDHISAMLSSGTSTSLQASYSGDLLLSGAINGMVNYNLSLSQTSSGSGACIAESGQVGGFSINVKSGC